MTHILSFAQQVYGENGTATEFISAEHLQGGMSTFKILPRTPEMTSSGFELYDENLKGN